MLLRLHITAEGQTEARFVKDVLSPYLGEHAVWADARCVLTSKDKRAGISHRGGFRLRSAYPTVKKDICTWMREDQHPDVRFTTMFDLYALPSDFPGYSQARCEADPFRRVEILEQAFANDINGELNVTRFVPYKLNSLQTVHPGNLAVLGWCGFYSRILHSKRMAFIIMETYEKISTHRQF